MLRLHARFGDESTGGAGNLPDTDGTAAGPTYLTVAGGDSWGWFGRINPGFTLPAGIKQPEQRELPSNSSGHAGQGGDNALASYQIAPAGFDGGVEVSVNSLATKFDPSSVSAPLSGAQPGQLKALKDTVTFAALGPQPDAVTAAAPAATADKSGPAAPVAPVSAGLHINLIADANNVNAPAGWAAAVQTAASIIEQNFSDPVTINLRYGYASFRNVVDPNLVGSGGAYANTDAGTTGNYNTVSGWLLGDRTTADDFTAYANLPASSASFPGGANNFYVPDGELRALGQLADNSTIDGSAAFGTGISLSNMVPVAIHELTHAMGRISLHYTPGNLPVIADWFRYDAAGHFQWTEGNSSASPSYFSIDGGVTDIADFGRTSDYSDFLNSGVQSGLDPFNEFYSNSTLHSLTTQDIRELDVIGFNRVADYAANITTTGVVAANNLAGSTGSIAVGGQHDWFRTTLTAGVSYRIDEHGVPSGQGTLTDTVLALWDSTGTTQLASNDDSNGTLESEFFYTPASSGTYYVDAAAFSTLTGTYTVHVTTDDHAGGISTTGVVATTGVGTTGSIELSGDHDWFRVTLTAGVSYRFDEHGVPSGQGTLTDTVLALHDSTGTQLLAVNDDSNGTLESEFFYTPATNGTYFVDAAAFDGLTGTYTVHVAPDDYAGGVSTAGQVSVGGSATGSVEVSGDHDWFRTSLTAGTSYRFDENGAPHNQGTLPDPVMALWDSTGTTQLAFNDDSHGTLDSEFIYTPATSGTYYVDAGAFGSNTGTYTVSAAVLPVARDFNFDGHSDLLWQDTGGQSAIWETSGTSVIGGGLAGANPGPSWLVKGSGDFNGDAYTDILWQNTGGQAAVWEMNGTSVIGGGAVGGNPGSSWQVVGAGDFNADGKSDILWQNTSGQAAIWEMNGTNVIDGGLAGANPGASWQVKGSGDFNGDGYTDILWQNTSGQAAVWEMNGTSVIGGGAVGGNPGSSWQVVGAGDFNADAKSDILWQNTSGQAAIWEMDGTNVIGGGPVGPNPGPSWQVKGAGDYNGDGFSDIMWQDTSGQAAIWEMNGTNVIGSGAVGGNPGPSWHIFAA